MWDDILGVVIDAGSQNLKAGFAGEPSPRIMVPTTVGRFRRAGLPDGIPTIYCGKEAIRNRGISNLVWPVQEGLVKNWDDMEKLWHHVFYKELHVPPEDTRVMHAVHPLMTGADKERLAEILFESFTIQALYLAKIPTLTLQASGRTSGIVWEDGYACSYVAPVFEGFHLKHSTVVSPWSGKMMTEQLQRLLFKIGYSFTTPTEFDIMEDIKKEICYVTLDYEKELALEAKVKYKLPDGQHIELGAERFQVAEVMFQPSLAGLQYRNIIETINQCIDLCDLDYRKLFFKNIIISGGSSLFPGLAERVLKDLTHYSKAGFRPKVEAHPLRQYAAWAGGSMMASMNHLKGFWLTKQEYEDSGTTRVKYKFF